MSETSAVESTPRTPALILTLAAAPGRKAHAFYFVAPGGAASDVGAYLDAVAGAMRRYLPAPSYRPAPGLSAHEAIVDFLGFVGVLAADDGDLGDDGPEAATIVAKAREYTRYLHEICERYGVNPLREWKAGIVFREQRPAVFGFRHRAARLREAQGQATLTNGVREQIEHLHTLCTINLPRDEQTRAEEKRRAEAHDERMRAEIRAEEAAQFERKLAELRQAGMNPDTSATANGSGMPWWYKPTAAHQVSVTYDVAAAPQRHEATGALHDFVGHIDGHGRFVDDDVVVIRLPLDADLVWDPDFAAIFTATFELDNPAAVAAIYLGIGDDRGLVCEPHAAGADRVHIVWGGRFLEPPRDPYFQIRLVMRATAAPLRIAATKLFAGHHFDPYVFNPQYREVAEHSGHPSFPGGAEVLATFERDARLAAQTGTYIDSQAFVRPYLVMREGAPRFPMLLGSVNAVYWYGIGSRHGLEFFKEWNCVSAGETVIDCGAHAGQMAAYFAIVAGPEGRVVAIDPFAQNCLQIAAQGQLNAPGRIRVIQAGVGSSRQTLHVSNRAQMTAKAETDDLGDRTEIEIIPLDDLRDIAPSFIKLDVEGAEVDALIGAAATLRQCTPKLFIEVHTQFIGRFGYTLTDLFAAIPAELYDVRVQIEGVDASWQPYTPGLEIGVTVPLLVYATPKTAPPRAPRGA